jgi:acyl-[acyl-carrier-protein] desaturase
MLPAEAILANRVQVIRSLEDFVGENLGFLAPIDRIWQPSELLPDLTGEDWREPMHSFREPAQQISDAVLVVLVGDMVTEEALPNYAVSLNLIADDVRGDSDRPWAKWLRGWTAEENRHGDLLNAYLRLTGRVDMHAVELSVHRLLAGGFNPRVNGDPYRGLVYTSFQERATKISHSNVGNLVAAEGDANLAAICQRIAGDESRHETFYTRAMGQVMEIDPEGGLMCFRDMLRTTIAMPGREMHDGKDPDLFEHFSLVAQRLGVYTVQDYAAIIQHLVSTWGVAGRSVTGKAAKAQEYLCLQAERFAGFGEEVAAHLATQPPVAFSWIHDRRA